MKTTTLLALTSLFYLTSGLYADDLPKPMKFERYQKMLDHSPFAVATAAAATGTLPDFARDLFIANAAHSVDGDFVTLASNTDNNFKKYLTSKEPTEGYSISNVEWSDRVGETKVTISKDGQFATLTFNQALISQAIPGATPLQLPAGMPPRPLSATEAQPGITRLQPAPIPMLPTPPAHIRGMIHHSPKGADDHPGGRPLQNLP